MSQAITKADPKDVRASLEKALKIAFRYFPAGVFDGAGFAGDKGLHEAFAAAGVDPSLSQIRSSGYGFEYRHETRLSFDVSVEVLIELFPRFGDGDNEVRIGVKWASGPGHLESATAAARLHLDACERANSAKIAIRDAFRGFRFDPSKPEHVEALEAISRDIQKSARAKSEAIERSYFKAREAAEDR